MASSTSLVMSLKVSRANHQGTEATEKSLA